MLAWHPGPGGGSQLRLQELQQRHEIPDGKDMVLHERAELLLCLNRTKNGMGLNGLKRWLQCI